MLTEYSETLKPKVVKQNNKRVTFEEKDKSNDKKSTQIIEKPKDDKKDSKSA